MFPFKMAVVGALPAQYLGRGPGPLYIGLATTSRGHLIRSHRVLIRLIGDRTHPSSSSHQLKNTSREAVHPLYDSSSAPEAIHRTTHWSRVLHHNGGPNQYKSRGPCVVHRFQLRSHEAIGRRLVGERSSCAPQSSNLKGLPEPNIQHLARQVGVRQNLSSTVRI